jgi:hypothetical protein
MYCINQKAARTMKEKNLSVDARGEVKNSSETKTKNRGKKSTVFNPLD